MILVTAALGIIGREAIDELNRMGVPTRALIPNEHKRAELDTWFDERRLDRRLLDIAVGDLADPASLGPALEGVERAVIIYPALNADVSMVEAFAAAAAGRELQHVVHLSAIGASREAPTRLGRLFGTCEQIVAGLGVPYTHLQPHMFLLMQNIRSFAEEIQNQQVLRLPLGRGRSTWIDARDISAAIARVVVGAGTGQTHVLTGPEALSGVDIVEMLGRTAGYRLRFEDLEPEVARKRMLAAKMQPWLVEDSLVMFEAFRAGVAAGVSPTLRQLIGNEGRRFNQFAYEYAWAFRKGEAEGQLSGWLN